MAFVLRGCLGIAILIGVPQCCHAATEPAVASVTDEKAESEKTADARPITAKSLYSAIQKLGVKYRKDKNAVENDLRFVNLREEMVKQFGSVSITYRTKIKTVTWKDGVANLTIEWPLPAAEPGNASPIKFSSPAPLELKMDAKEAAAIKPDDWVTFTGTLTLQPKKWGGGVGAASHSQQLFTITHYNLLPNHYSDIVLVPYTSLMNTSCSSALALVLVRRIDVSETLNNWNKTRLQCWALRSLTAALSANLFD